MRPDEAASRARAALRREVRAAREGRMLSGEELRRRRAAWGIKFFLAAAWALMLAAWLLIGGPG